MRTVLLCISILLWCPAARLFADEPKRPVYNHVTQEGSRLDPLISAAYAGRFEITVIGDADYFSPKFIRGHLALFCQSSAGAYLTGDVVVAYVITTEGATTDQVVIESTDERLNATALASASEWRFEPAQLRGTAISTVAAQEFHFKQPPQDTTGKVPPAASGAGSPRPMQEFTILGTQKILCEVDGQTPSLAGKDGVKVRQPAFVAREGEFAYQFAIDAGVGVTKIIVEDVSESAARILLEDSSPKVEGGYWMEVSTPMVLSKQNLPWIYERGDTTRVFRFTISISGKSDPVVLYQPVVWKLEAKKYLRKLVK
jgi:TonB family protein